MAQYKDIDEEIINGLVSKAEAHCEVCDIKEIVPCEHCVFHYTKQAVDLINRQREEIEVIKETTAEIRYEAIKEFAERLKAYYRNLERTAGGLVEYHIDQIVKEFCGADSQDND